MAPEQQSPGQTAWYLRSSIPVLFPSHAALQLSDSEFEAFLKEDLAGRGPPGDKATAEAVDPGAISPPSPTADRCDRLDTVMLDEGQPTSEHPFVQGLLSTMQQTRPDLTNKVLTDNGDVAFRSTENALMDLFAELEEAVSGPRLVALLDAAWAQDSLATLKMIFNARSIHLGKSSRMAFYRGAGWLAQKHPLTLVLNLRWLTRPVIEKKGEKGEEENEKEEKGEEKTEKKEEKEKAAVSRDVDDALHFDVRNGVAHGYWKDLLNLLALAANGKLDALASPRDVLNVNERRDAKTSAVDAATAKAQRHVTRTQRHERAVRLFTTDATYRALHLSVARLFAEQLRRDLAALHGDSEAAKQRISLCGKWAPSADRFHDRHTFVVSTVAELLRPRSAYGDVSWDRELYLRHAREDYRLAVSALRARLDVVERHLSGGTLGAIAYARLPSMAMQAYAGVFASKDGARFDAYLDAVASGHASISGATLSTASLVVAVRSMGQGQGQGHGNVRVGGRDYAGQQTAAKIRSMRARVADAQWTTLVQRMRDAGTLAHCIAVCDVSGSMTLPVFADGTCPMDTAIGLSLLMADLAAPPFAGLVIRFSATPQVLQVNVAQSLTEKVACMDASPAGYDTNFVAVFEDLILPMARKHRLPQKDMVRRVFAFSDMQFNEAQRASERWDSAYERVERRYREAGYDMPEMVFWNLAGGRAGDAAPKPVKADQPGTALVSGYSQAMLKVFLDGGSFAEAEDAEDDDLIEVEADGDEAVEVHKKQLNPARLANKAISHKAYGMLRVVD